MPDRGVYIRPDDSELVVLEDGKIRVRDGGELLLESGATLSAGDGVLVWLDGDMEIPGTLTVGGHSAFGPDAAINQLLPYDLYASGPSSGTTPSVLVVQSDVTRIATDHSVQGIASILNVEGTALGGGSIQGLYGYVGAGNQAYGANGVWNIGVLGISEFDGQVDQYTTTIQGGVFRAVQRAHATGPALQIEGVWAEANLVGGAVENLTGTPNLVGVDALVRVGAGATGHEVACFYAGRVQIAGNVDNLYGLYVDTLSTTGAGAISGAAFGVYVEGNNRSRFGGPIDVLNLPTTDPARTGAFWTVDAAGVSAALVAGARYVMLSKGP